MGWAVGSGFVAVTIMLWSLSRLRVRGEGDCSPVRASQPAKGRAVSPFPSP